MKILLFLISLACSVVCRGQGYQVPSDIPPGWHIYSVSSGVWSDLGPATAGASLPPGANGYELAASLGDAQADWGNGGPFTDGPGAIGFQYDGGVPDVAWWSDGSSGYNTIFTGCGQACGGWSALGQGIPFVGGGSGGTSLGLASGTNATATLNLNIQNAGNVAKPILLAIILVCVAIGVYYRFGQKSKFGT